MTTKELIFNTTLQLFKKYGYKKTSLHMIAEECGITKSLLTYHYPQKGDLLIELLESHLIRVYDYVTQNVENDLLLSFFVFHRIYYNVMIFDESSMRFHKEVLERSDRKIATYENFRLLYFSIVKALDLDMTKESFLLLEISLFGGNRELIWNFYNHTISITKEELIDLIIENTCRCFGINNLIIHEYKEKASKVYLDYSHLNLF
ncbi:MAG: TetR/AcrR family transcriptional regulator [Eubacteriales bacterium]